MQLEVGSVFEGKVTGITNFGAFVEMPDNRNGMVHISEVAPTYVKEIRDYLKEGQIVKVKVLSITEEGKVSLSIKKAMDPPPAQPRRRSTGYKPANNPGSFEWQASTNAGGSFEDMMSKFKQTSDEKMSDLKRSLDSKHGGFSRRNSSNK